MTQALPSVSIIVVSLMGKKPEQDVIERFENAEQSYNHEMKNL